MSPRAKADISGEQDPASVPTVDDDLAGEGAYITVTEIIPEPEPLPGFVRVRHEITEAVADIPAVALASHQSRGWVLDSPPEADPEAVASDPEPKES